MACDPVVDDRVSEPEPELRTLSGDWGCRDCGYTNSPYCGVHPMGWFSLEQKVPPDTTRLVEIEDVTGARYPVYLDGQTVVAESPSGVVYGNGLLGWKLVFEDGVSEFLVEILEYEEEPDWVQGQPIPTYGLGYRDPTDPEAPLVNVCPGYIPDETSVVFITNELYDTEAKTVIPDQYGWVTATCRGHALTKMKFLGYDPNDGYGSSWEQRQATLKMITADYCGNGTSFTAVGQPLQWIDELGHFLETDLPSLGEVEARWTADGAECLDKPRLVDRTDVEALCPSIPACKGEIDLSGVTWETLVP